MPPSRIGIVITDDGADEAALQRLRDAGIKVRIASTSSAPAIARAGDGRAAATARAVSA